ncbi:MAG: cytochrome c3 family protein [Candidatus Loosdrechtia sp.]|uniref:cytochrome c3 family protein n=1 Tax=Candidatus Loosdrechtia sp. TaxID=3101272 RepID=UPI003A70C904|nr:MAG: cytochrome c3 family protein [Candidatus Jettenia sp. AMX2]
MFNEVKKLNKKTTVRLAIFSLAAIGVVVVVFGITMARPNYPQYCAKCHDAITFNNACKKLSGEIGCIDCHTHENEGLRMMATEMSNEHCTAEQCHPLSTLLAKTSVYKSIKPFQHKTHIYRIAGSFSLKCTSCHSGVGGEKHFETNETTCNTCHFIDTKKLFYVQDKKPISDCTLCHGHIKKTTEIYGKTFNHDVYEGNEKVLCSDCHFQIIQGYGEVDRKNCFQCHIHVTDKYQSVPDLHDIHINKHKTDCSSCHASIKHGWPETQNVPDTIYESSYSKTIQKNHTIQKLIMMGQGGRGVKGKPDPMCLATLNCSACHKDKQFSTNVAPEVCNNCHERGFDKILSEQIHFTVSGMRLLNSLLGKAKRQRNARHPVIQEAEVNYQLIKEDGSNGAHNIKYVKDLLDYSIENVKQVIGEPVPDHMP